MKNMLDNSFVLQELGLTELTPGEQDEVLTDVTQNMLLRVYARVLEKLPDEARLQFQQLLEEEKRTDAEALAAARIPEIGLLTKNACAEVLAEYKEAL